MKRSALQKASEHLSLAREAVARMAEATSFRDYERAWTEFLAQASRFYSKLEQGSKGCAKSEPWFGRRKHERKKDPLLSYIHHARDCEEHTIDDTTSIQADSLVGRMGEDGSIRMRFEFMIDDKGKQHYRNIAATGADGEPLPYELINPKVALLTVRDARYGDQFDPPQMHMDRPIVDLTPRGVAGLALAYLSDFLADAQKLPTHL